MSERYIVCEDAARHYALGPYQAQWDAEKALALIEADLDKYPSLVRGRNFRILTEEEYQELQQTAGVANDTEALRAAIREGRGNEPR